MTLYAAPDRRRLLAEALKRLRLSAGKTHDDLSQALDVSQSTISRLENGRQRVSVAQVRQWCAATGAEETRTAELVALAEDVLVGAPSWEALRGDPGPSTVGSLNTQDIVRKAEQTALKISNYGPLQVPGLLQTSAYSLRIVTSDGPIPDAAERVLMRMERQDAALADERRQLRFLVPEALLRWPFGTVGEQLEQVGKIATTITERTNVEIGILPLRPNPVWRLHGFAIYDQVTEGEPFVHLELLTRPLDEVEPSRVERYRRAYERLREQAVFADEARELLDVIAADLRR